MSHFKTSVGALLLSAAALPAQAEILREQLTAISDPDVEIAIRKVSDSTQTPSGDPVILLHGARVPGVPSFDLPVEGGSLAADLAGGGLAVYIVDLRGYGASTRPGAMDEDVAYDQPLVRSNEAVRDLHAAVEAVKQDSGADQVSILGWATGGHWAGIYAGLYPENVGRIVFYNSLYGYTDGHDAIGPGSENASSSDPERFGIETVGNYRLNDAEGLLPSWDRSIPGEDKSAWRDPAIAEAYVEAALESDPTSESREPASFRAPSGAMADSFLLASGAALWDARLIDADVLIVRSGNDFWSRHEDASLLKEHLDQRASYETELLTIPDATHYVHLDRDEAGRDIFYAAVEGFLTGEGE